MRFDHYLWPSFLKSTDNNSKTRTSKIVVLHDISKPILLAGVLRVGRVSVAIRRLVHSSWYRPAGERPSWAGTSWTGTARQGQVKLDRDQLDRQGFLMCISICSFPSRIDSNKQCF